MRPLTCTSELVGRAIADAVAAAGLPAGTFSLVFGSGRGMGIALVTDPRVKAVGFTGSRSGETALVEFVSAARDAMAGTAASPMLTPNIAATYAEGVSALGGAAQLVGRGAESDTPNSCRAALFSTHAAGFLASALLQSEVFGASSLVIRCADVDELLAVAGNLEGQLTASTPNLTYACDTHWPWKTEEIVKPGVLEYRDGAVAVPTTPASEWRSTTTRCPRCTTSTCAAAFGTATTPDTCGASTPASRR